jgi:lipopolysaccharide export system protein LptA
VKPILRADRPAAFALAVAFLSYLPAATAEKADRDKPTNIEANRMVSDDVRRMTIFEGNVVLTKGTINIRADRIVVRQDAEGFQLSTATGAPVRFRQRADPKDNKEGVWLDGEALRIEVNDREERIELFERARVTRDQDEVRGDYIFVDQRSEFFSATSGKQSDGRVRAVIQPKNPAPAPGAAPGPAAAPVSGAR